MSINQLLYIPSKIVYNVWIRLRRISLPTVGKTVSPHHAYGNNRFFHRARSEVFFTHSKVRSSRKSMAQPRARTHSQMFRRIQLYS